MTKITFNDGMKIYWDHPIEMEDGVILRADIFCPAKDGKHPVIMTYGVYGKWLDFRDGYKPQWDIMVDKFPEVMNNSSCKYQNWEVVDPEKWVPGSLSDDYRLVFDARLTAGIAEPSFADVQQVQGVGIPVRGMLLAITNEEQTRIEELAKKR